MRRHFAIYAWLLSVVVAIIAIVAWGQGLHWQFSNLSTYRLFPLFGLLAFSLIWSMYAVGLAKRRLKPKETPALAAYYQYLPTVILIFIFLHPSLLIWQLWRDGFGLPPTSYKKYVGPAAVWAVIVSSIAWFIFLVYELRRFYRNRPWWKYVEVAGDAAMVGIVLHSLRLGSNLQHGWLKYVWLFYGAVLAVALVDIYSRKLTRRHQT